MLIHNVILPYVIFLLCAICYGFAKEKNIFTSFTLKTKRKTAKRALRTKSDARQKSMAQTAVGTMEGIVCRYTNTPSDQNVTNQVTKSEDVQK